MRFADVRGPFEAVVVRAGKHPRIMASSKRAVAEAVLARFRGKGKPSRLDEEEEEEVDEDAEVDDADADDDDDDDAAEEPAGEEDE